MARPKTNGPTPGEIEILHVIWKHDVCSVREVHEQLVKKRPVAHTTVASMMQLMEGKGQLRVVEPRRPFRYEAVMSQDDAKDALLADINTRMFGGSLKKLVLHMVAHKNPSKQKLQKLEQLLDQIK